MTEEQARAETVSLLQDLGLKEYEARCFLALTQLSTATAKEISDVSEVPRTRVYDAIRVLEAEGLVAVHHSSPQQFRAVSIDEATATLRRKYDDRLDTLESYLEQVELQEDPGESEQVQEVWSMSGHDGIESRTIDLLADAESEIILVIIDEEILTETLFESLQDAVDRGVDVVIGGHDDVIVEQVRTELPGIRTFESELGWLVGPGSNGDEVAIGRILFVDRTTLLVSSYYPSNDPGDAPTEKAIYADGLDNGIVVLIRRMLSTGLIAVEGPA